MIRCSQHLDTLVNQLNLYVEDDELRYARQPRPVLLPCHAQVRFVLRP